MELTLACNIAVAATENKQEELLFDPTREVRLHPPFLFAEHQY